MISELRIREAFLLKSEIKEKEIIINALIQKMDSPMVIYIETMRNLIFIAKGARE